MAGTSEDSKSNKKRRRYSVPPELPPLLEDMAREVLKNMPDNIYEFLGNYVKSRLDARDKKLPFGPTSKGKPGAKEGQAPGDGTVQVVYRRPDADGELISLSEAEKLGLSPEELVEAEGKPFSLSEDKEPATDTTTAGPADVQAEGKNVGEDGKSVSLSQEKEGEGAETGAGVEGEQGKEEAVKAALAAGKEPSALAAGKEPSALAAGEGSAALAVGEGSAALAVGEGSAALAAGEGSAALATGEGPAALATGEEPAAEGQAEPQGAAEGLIGDEAAREGTPPSPAIDSIGEEVACQYSEVGITPGEEGSDVPPPPQTLDMEPVTESQAEPQSVDEKEAPREDTRSSQTLDAELPKEDKGLQSGSDVQEVACQHDGSGAQDQLCETEGESVATPGKSSLGLGPEDASGAAEQPAVEAEAQEAKVPSATGDIILSEVEKAGFTINDDGEIVKPDGERVSASEAQALGLISTPEQDGESGTLPSEEEAVQDAVGSLDADGVQISPSGAEKIESSPEELVDAEGKSLSISEDQAEEPTPTSDTSAEPAQARPSYMIKSTAATKIQAGFRGFKTRRELQAEVQKAGLTLDSKGQIIGEDGHALSLSEERELGLFKEEEGKEEEEKQEEGKEEIAPKLLAAGDVPTTESQEELHGVVETLVGKIKSDGAIEESLPAQLQDVAGSTMDAGGDTPPKQAELEDLVEVLVGSEAVPAVREGTTPPQTADSELGDSEEQVIGSDEQPASATQAKAIEPGVDAAGEDYQYTEAGDTSGHDGSDVPVQAIVVGGAVVAAQGPLFNAEGEPITETEIASLGIGPGEVYNADGQPIAVAPQGAAGGPPPKAEIIASEVEKAGFTIDAEGQIVKPDGETVSAIEAQALGLISTPPPSVAYQYGAGSGGMPDHDGTIPTFGRGAPAEAGRTATPSQRTMGYGAVASERGEGFGAWIDENLAALGRLLFGDSSSGESRGNLITLAISLVVAVLLGYQYSDTAMGWYNGGTGGGTSGPSGELPSGMGLSASGGCPNPAAVMFRPVSQ